MNRPFQAGEIINLEERKWLKKEGKGDLITISWGKLLVRTISYESRKSHNWIRNRGFILVWYLGTLWMGTKKILSLSKQSPKKRWPGLPPSSSSSLFIMAHNGTIGTVSMVQSLCQSQLCSVNVTAWSIWSLTQAVKGCPFLPRSGRSWQAQQRLQKTSGFQLAWRSVLSCTQFSQGECHAILPRVVIRH